MKSQFRLYCAALVMACAPASLSAQPTLEDYGKLPGFEKAAISPDGKRYAIIATVKGVRQLMIIENRKLIRNLGVGDEKVRHLSWCDNDLVMLTLSRTEDLSANFNVRKAEMNRTLFIPTGDEQAEMLFARQKKIAPVNFGFYGLREIEGKRFGFFAGVAMKSSKYASNFTKYVFEGGSPGLYRVDLEDFSTKRMAIPTSETNEGEDWLVGANGDLVATLTVDDSGKWKLKGHKEKISLAGRQSQGRVYMAGLWENGKYLILGKADEGSRSYRFSKIDLASGNEEPFMAEERPRGFYTNHLTGEIYGYTDRDEDPIFFDPAIGKRRAKIKQAFPKLDRRIVDFDDNFTKVVLETNGNADSGTYWQVDLTALRAEPLGYQYNNIAPNHVGKISTVRYKAADGLEMDGILTLPPGKEAKNLPVIMLPHGGPRAHDEEVFDWWAQSYANEGYAVFQPNFRGSTGRGQAFVEAGYGEWGRKMQTDISDGLKHLAQQGIVDPARACIVGASYGGYAALAGATLQQGVYRCSVAVNGVSDLPLMASTELRESLNNRLVMQDLKRMVGSGKDLKAISPRRFAENASAPILLIHGKDDTVVPFRQSKVMADALKDAKKPYELVSLEGEDHWLSLSETRLKMLKATMRFVKKHNPPN